MGYNDDGAIGGPVPCQPDKTTLMQVEYLLTNIVHARLTDDERRWAEAQDASIFVKAEVVDGRPVSIETAAYSEAEALRLAYNNSFRVAYKRSPESEPPGFSESGWPSWGCSGYHFEKTWYPWADSDALYARDAAYYAE
jgi:hypothetical protein